MADLSGVQQAVQKIAEQTVKDQGKQALPDSGSANIEDVQKLQAALNQQAGSQPPASGAQAAGTETVQAVQATSSSSPGSRILESVNNMRTGLQEAVQDLNATLNNSNLASPADLMKVQMKLQEVTLQQDLMGKVVSKSEQNVDTLLKGQ